MASNLLNPITLPCGVTIQNRIVKSAMSEGLGAANYAPSSALIHLYEKFCAGGSGIVITGNVMIDSNARGESRNVVIEDESHLDALKSWAASANNTQSALWVQLNHPGKQSPRTVSKHPVAPSAIPLTGFMKLGFKNPRALEIDEIREIIRRFKVAATVVKKAGFGGVQIHAAHGYLISQFLSPLHNQRTDQYGGSLENRMRFLVEIYQAIRSGVGETFPIGIKMNIDDFKEGGMTPIEAVNIIETLESRGLDLIELSGGSYESPVMMGSSPQEGFFLEAINAHRENIIVPLVITGGFRSKDVMEKVIATGQADLIGLARPLVVAPDIPLRLRKNTFEKITLVRMNTGFKRLDKIIGPIVGLGAYEVQMHNMAHDRPVRFTKNAWAVLMRLLWLQRPAWMRGNH
jgi:2,4-dienoyl-CoA reductase-like NADH-dependent reductase (Old Yellow Enzyme family)